MMNKLTSVKLIVSDIDGTLFNDSNKLPDSFFEVYNDLRKLEIEFVIASGRQMNNLCEIFKPIRNDLTFIAQNGSYIMSKGIEMYADPIKKCFTNELISKAREISNAYILAYGRKALYIEDTSSEFTKMLSKCNVPYQVVTDLLKISNDSVFKISIYDIMTPAKNSYPHLIHFTPNLNFAISGNFWLDITSKNSNKGHALSIVQKNFNISYDQTMVFGDYENDLEMMKYAYFSYAMNNAEDKVKKIARFIAPSNNENGVLTIVRHLIDCLSKK